MVYNQEYPAHSYPHLVSTSWRNFDGGVSIRIYVSCDNNIVEKCTDGDGWYIGQLRVPGKAAAVTSWMNGGIFIRVYVIHQGILQEYCWDGNGWYQGAFQATAMNITAESWVDDTGVHIRVYGMNNSEEGTEYCYEDGRGWLKRQI
jgi:hypothetical protein